MNTSVQELIEQLTQRMRKLIEQHGFCIQGVAADEPYCYTIGLTDKGKRDIISLADIRLASILNEIGTRDDIEIGVPFTSSLFRVNMPDGSKANLRCILQEYPFEKFRERSLGAFNTRLVTKVPTVSYELILGDADNKLPGE